MTYYNRFEQLLFTIKSIKRQLLTLNEDVEIIVVNDCSTDGKNLNEIGEIKVIELQKENKWYTNSCVPFNIGIEAAKGEIIILQNAECCHIGNILEFVKNNLTNENYLAFSAYALDQNKSILFRKLNEDIHKKFILGLPQIKFNKIGWYNHKCNPTYYHFCSAITKSNMEKLGGFDERYAYGIAFDDNELVERVTRLGLNKIIPDYPFVAHQWHSKATHFSVENYGMKHEANKKLFYSVTKNESIINVLKWKQN